MLKERLKTAAVLIAGAGLALYVGGALLILVAVGIFCAVNFEYFTFGARLPHREAIANSCLMLLIPAGYLFDGWRGWGLSSAAVLLLVFSELVFVIERRQHQSEISELVPAMLLGTAYTGMLGSLVVAAAALPGSSRAVAWLLAVVILSDSCAYFGGRSLNTPNLAPRISPKKTWGGAVCGFIGAVLGGVFVFGALGLPGHWLHAALFSAAAGVLCQIGDLVESLIKRVYSVKDSGTVLPGHGGVLDRVDGLIFSAPLLLFIGL